jgi:hypothetical protein
MKNEIRETSRTLRKKEEISERKVINLKQSVRTKMSQTYKGINEFKECHQPRINLIKYGNVNLPCTLKFPQ